MFVTLLCFTFGFLLQGILVALVVNYFQNLSEKRRQRSISDWEKWIQAVISIVAKPALEVILRKDQVGIRVLVTTCLLISSGLALFFSVTPDGIGCLFSLTLLLLAVTWLSLRV